MITEINLDNINTFSNLEVVVVTVIHFKSQVERKKCLNREPSKEEQPRRHLVDGFSQKTTIKVHWPVRKMTTPLVSLLQDTTQRNQHRITNYWIMQVVEKNSNFDE